MKKFKQVTCFALVGILLLSLVATLAGCSFMRVETVSRDPNAQLLKSIEATKAALIKGFQSDPLMFIADALKKGSISLEQEDQLMGKQIFRIHADAEKKAYAMIMEAELEEEKEAYAFYLSNSELCISVPDLPGEKPYSLNLKTLSADLKESQIWDNVDMTYDEFMAEYGDDVAEMEKLGEDAKNTQGYADFKTMLQNIEAIVKESQVTVTEGSVLTTSDMVKCINIRYSMSTEQLQKIVDEFTAWAKLYYADAMSVSGALEGGELGMTEEEVNTELDAMKQEISKMLTDTNAKATITISINPNTETIVKAECHMTTNVDKNTEYVTVTLDLGENPANSQAYQFRVATSNGTNPEAVYKITYERMDGNNTYGRNFRYEERNMYGDESRSEITFNWNKTDNTYVIETSADGDKQSIAGDFKMSETKLEMTFTGEAVSGKTVLVVERGTEVPAMPERVNILKLTDLEYLDLVEYFETLQPEDNWDEDDWSGDDEYEDYPMVSAIITDADGTVTVYMASTEEANVLDALLADEMLTLNEDGTLATVNNKAPDEGFYWAVFLNNEEIEPNELGELVPDTEGVSFVCTAEEAASITHG